MTIDLKDLNPKIKPLFDCLKLKLLISDHGISELREKGVFHYYDILTIKYYFNSKGQTRFKVKHSKSKNGFIYFNEGITFKPEEVTDKNVKKFEKVLSKYLNQYVIEFEDD